MKHGTISDRNLVLEYFKMKAEEDIGMMCRDEPIISNEHKILEVEHADGFGQYLMPIIVEQGSLFTSPIEPLDRNMDIQGQGVVRQIFQEEMCLNDMNEERQDEGETNEQRKCEEGRKSLDKENKEKDQEMITEHKEMNKVLKIGNEKNEGETKSDKKIENEMERFDVDLALQDIGLQVIKEEAKDDVTIFVDKSTTGGSACDEVSELESRKSNLEKLEEELCVPDKNVNSQWSLLEDIDEDTFVKTVASKTENIHKDDEEEDDPMEYECYDESDRLYFKSARK